jgi:hypothetical protein
MLCVHGPQHILSIGPSFPEGEIMAEPTLTLALLGSPPLEQVPFGA